MILKIYNIDSIPHDAEDQLYVTLGQKGDDIIMHVVDKHGQYIENSNILIIDNDYKCIFTIEGLPDVVPLKTNICNEVLVYKHKDMEDLRNRAFVHHITRAVKKEMQESQEQQESTAIKH